MIEIVKVISEFDSFLFLRSLRFKGIVIGGAALNLLGIVSRLTNDCDVLDPNIPNEILKASEDFALNKIAKEPNCLIKKDWLNNGPTSLKQNLPKFWEARTQPLFIGKAIEFHTLGRPDLIMTKLYAHCDRQSDLFDCLALKPSIQELKDSIEWVKYQDAKPKWPAHVEEIFKKLAKELSYEF